MSINPFDNNKTIDRYLQQSEIVNLDHEVINGCLYGIDQEIQKGVSLNWMKIRDNVKLKGLKIGDEMLCLMKSYVNGNTQLSEMKCSYIDLRGTCSNKVDLYNIRGNYVFFSSLDAQEVVLKNIKSYMIEFPSSSISNDILIEKADIMRISFHNSHISNNLIIYKNEIFELDLYDTVANEKLDLRNTYISKMNVNYAICGDLDLRGTTIKHCMDFEEFLIEGSIKINRTTKIPDNLKKFLDRIR